MTDEMTIPLPDMAVQQMIADMGRRIEELEAQLVLVPCPAEIPLETLLYYSQPDYEHPNAEDVRAVLKLAGLTGSAAGNVTGVNGRTVRKWTGGESIIPYAAWRKLVEYARLSPSEIKN